MIRIWFLHLILLLSIVLQNTNLWAQYDFLMYENFVLNNSSFLDSKYCNNQNLQLQNKSLILKTNNKLESFLIEKYIDGKKDFVIESNLKQISGQNNKAYGIIYGSMGYADSYVFYISSNQYFRIGKFSNEKFYPIIPWTKSSLIKTLGNYNNLKVEKKDKLINFYINQKLVYTCKSESFFGNLHGFLLSGEIVCQSSLFVIKTYQSQIQNVSFQNKKQRIKISSNINSNVSDIAPIFCDTILFFARVGHPDNCGDENDCDIWYSTYKNNQFSPAKHLGPPINNTGTNVVINYNQKNKTLYLEGLYNSQGNFLSNNGISYSILDKNGNWSIPKEIKIEDFKNQNKHATYCFTKDYKYLFMSVERPEGFGGLDIYVSEQKVDGSYSKPINLGFNINSYSDEMTPFVSNDGNYLYFSSYSRKGYGNADIFVSKRLDEKFLLWDQPYNLTNQINTPDWDSYFSISPDNKFAFFVNNNYDGSKENIYYLDYNENFNSVPLVKIFGKITDNQNNPIQAQILITNISDGSTIKEISSDKQGKYQFEVLPNQRFEIAVEKDGYMKEFSTIDFPIKSNSLNYDIKLYKMTKGQTLIMKTIQFERASSILRASSFGELNYYVDFLKKNPGIKISVDGYTDSGGDEIKLIDLSRQRALAVKLYLESKGIDQKRIMYQGYGKKNPISLGTSEQERSKNRRVEIRIL